MERLKAVARFLISRPVWLSLSEVAFVIFISNATFVFLVFAYLVETFSVPLALSVVKENIRSTEILVYLLALIAPTLWMMFSHWRARLHSPFYHTLLVLQFLIIAGSAYIYGKAKFGGVHNQAFVDGWARYCFCVGVVIWWITLVYDKCLPPIPRRPESGKDIIDKLESGT
jgi:hypothetical protein